MKYYFYPPRPKSNLILNPYALDFIQTLSAKCNVVNYNDRSNSAILNFIRYILSADVYIFNWIENVAYKKMGKLQFFVFLLLFPILLLRGVKIVWIFHNIQPHQGASIYSNIMRKLFFRFSSLIVTHSKEAENYLKKYSKRTSIFLNHPIKKRNIIDKRICKYDFLIWGSIEPYKGIVDFLEYLYNNSMVEKYNILIIGKCNNIDYINRLMKYCNEFIVYRNEVVNFDELEIYIKESKYVLFPYLKASVSSSGALMDTISMHGNVIGPNKGAFIDLAMQGLCFTYEDYKDIFKIYNSNNVVEFSKMEHFIEENSWKSFIDKIISCNL